MNNMHIAALLCTILSLIFLMIALTTNHWTDISLGYWGLWKVCTSALFGTSCASRGNSVSDYIHATRAFMCFAVIATIVAFLALCAIFSRSSVAGFQLSKVAAIANILAALFTLIAMATYTGSVGSNDFFGWSFGIGWTSVFLAIICGVLSYLIK